MAGNTLNDVSKVSSPARALGSHTVDSSLSTAVTLTPPSYATGIIIGVEAQNVRFRLDGVDPTTTVGFLLVPGDLVTIQFTPDTQTIRVIEVTPTATIQYQWVELR